MARGLELAGVVPLLKTVHQNSNRGHREVEKKLANSPRRSTRAEGVQRERGARGGGCGFRQDPDGEENWRLGLKLASGWKTIRGRR